MSEKSFEADIRRAFREDVHVDVLFAIGKEVDGLIGDKDAKIAELAQRIEELEAFLGYVSDQITKAVAVYSEAGDEGHTSAQYHKIALRARRMLTDDISCKIATMDLAPQSPWLPASQPPGEDGLYFVMIRREGATLPFASDARYLPHRKIWATGNMIDTVIAWMPIPAYAEDAQAPTAKHTPAPAEENEKEEK